METQTVPWHWVSEQSVEMAANTYAAWLNGIAERRARLARRDFNYDYYPEDFWPGGQYGGHE